MRRQCVCWWLRSRIRAPPRPGAIFCFSDLLAIGAMRAVFDAGLHTKFIAREAVRRVTARIEYPQAQAEEIVAGHRLVARESTLEPGPRSAIE